MILYLLVFLSGFAGLVYEVLWMKQLGLLFGNTSHAAAATLAAFFAGLAAGSWFWGRRSPPSPRRYGPCRPPPSDAAPAGGHHG
jgi:MFS family permease